MPAQYQRNKNEVAAVAGAFEIPRA
jgi:hypothetical protein